MAAQVIPPAGVLKSLNEVLDAIWRLRKVKGFSPKGANRSTPEQCFIKELDRSPYRVRGKSLDLWFRGQRNATWASVPSAFRPKELGDPKGKTFYEETSASFHFMLRRPEYRSQCASDFEWLALLQHYDGLTRLMDWSENVAVAMFFAVEQNKSDDSKSGSLYVLNAASLNEQSCLIADDVPQGSSVVPAEEARLGICLDTSPDVILRAAQAFCRTSTEWRSRVASVLGAGYLAELRWLAATLALLDEHAANKSLGKVRDPARHQLAELFLKKVTYPVAVFPRRSNSRLVAQAGMFTLHGGKGTMQGHIWIMRPFPSLRLWTWGSSMLGVAQVVAHAMIRSVAVDRRVGAEARRGVDRGHRIGFRQRS